MYPKPQPLTFRIVSRGRLALSCRERARVDLRWCFRAALPSSLPPPKVPSQLSLRSLPEVTSEPPKLRGKPKTLTAHLENQKMHSSQSSLGVLTKVGTCRDGIQPTRGSQDTLPSVPILYHPYIPFGGLYGLIL